MEHFNKFPVEEVIVAGTRGACGGVNMAIAETTWLLNQVNARCAESNRPRVLANHLPVHNIPEVERLKALGIEVFNNNWDLVPPRSAVILSAHGSPANYRQIAEEKDCFVLDVTCPLVIGNQRKVLKAAEQDQYVLVVGAKKHPEATSYLDRADESARGIVEDHTDIEDLKIPDNKNIMLITQTTMAVRGMAPIFAELSEKYGDRISLPMIKSSTGRVKGTICLATDDRQEGVANLVTYGIDGLVVVGSETSHNSKELAKIATNEGIPALLRDQAEQLNDTVDWFKHMKTVGLTAGASANEKETAEFIDWFANKGVNTFTESARVNPAEKLMFPLPHALQVKKEWDQFLAQYYS